MESPLEPYRKKRDFKATPEPSGEKKAKAVPGKKIRAKSARLSFVIQKHAASHLHYDFRLELDGRLLSWAVPKGPSLDPADKRLAMHVEDHPLDYADFEGTIPAGNYGAGTVIVWDRGEWIARDDPQAGYAKGKLKFELRGEKLQGGWTLVKSRGRTGKDNSWLLIKERDDAARPAAEFNVVEAMPDSVLTGASERTWQSNRPKKTTAPKTAAKAKNQRSGELSMPAGAAPARQLLTLAPQLAMLADAIPRGKDWSYELKLDGYRLLARTQGGDVKLFTRNGNDWTAKLTHIAKAVAALDIENGWLDGEIVMFDGEDRPSFQTLQNAFENSRTAQIQYFIFDLPYLNGHDLRDARLDARRALLEAVLKKAKTPLVFSRSLDMPAGQLFKHACDLQFEGLIGKRNGAPYRSTRSQDWIKLKCVQRQEFVIGGYTDSTRPGPDTFGSLLLGVHEPDGRLRYAGRVGTGFSHTSLRQLIAKMRPLQTDKMAFDIYSGERPTRATHWIKPKLVAEVAFTEWTKGGHVRHASFQGLRSDKLPGAITREQAAQVSAPVTAKNAAISDAPAKKRAKQSVDITVTHGDRVIDPQTGTTKQQLVDFYAAIAPAMLPHLRDRAVSLVRAPAGIDGQLFFQKHLQNLKIPGTQELPVDYFPGHPPLLTIPSREALLGSAQMNVIEFHTWNSTLADADHPDRMVFDLDPGEGIVWKQMQDATTLMKVMLEQLGLKGFLKTSGGKGMHVIVPLRPKYDWDTVKGFSHAIVKHMAATLPTLFVAKSGPKNRVKRIFIDYLRNGLGATTVSAFSVRARTGLGVSIPVEWEELSTLRGGNHWTITNASERLDKPCSKVWADYVKSHQRLEDAMHALEYQPASDGRD